MATRIGRIIAFTAKLSSYRILSAATGFSAGVMLDASFVELFFKGQEALVHHSGEPAGLWVNVARFSEAWRSWP
jgi:ZIP family zinc transporter